jgi:iron complex transport system substrate-binding protein
MLGRLIGEEHKAKNLVLGWESEIKRLKNIIHKKRPKIYFEEWDEPQISAIRWVSELIDICGGEDIFKERSIETLARGRFVTAEEVIERAPDIIFGCWCGKKVRVDKIAERSGWGDIPAVKNQQVFELEPEIFLQPGPALFVDGLRIMAKYLENWESKT